MLMVNQLTGFGAGGLFEASAVGGAWNAADKGGNVTLANGNRDAYLSSATQTQGVRGTLSKSSETCYFEVEVIGGANLIGVSKAGSRLDGPGFDADGWGLHYGGSLWHNNILGGVNGVQFTAGDIVMVFADLSTSLLWFGKNGVWAGNPAAGTSAAFSGVTGPLFPHVLLGLISEKVRARFSPGDFAYSPPR